MRGRQGPPDKRLFRRARGGDAQAFGALLRRYDPRLRRLAARLIAEPERIDTVLTRAYLRAWRSVPMVVPPGSVAEWLYRIVYNACINEMRWAPERPAPPPLPGPRVPLPLASASRRLAGLRALAPEERVPLVLVDGEGFSLEATARILGRSERDTAADLTRARYRWRGMVVGEAPYLPDDTVVEIDMPPDPEAVPPLAELAEVDTSGPELGGHVKVVANGTPAPDASTPPASDDDTASGPKRKRASSRSSSASSRRRSRPASRRGANSTDIAAGTATQLEGDAPDAAGPSEDAREN